MDAGNYHEQMLIRLIDRLEAATSRLEDIATSTTLPEHQRSPSTANGTKTIAASPAPAAAPVPRAMPEPLPDSVEDFDSFILDTVTKYVKLSEGVGGPVAEQARQVLKAFSGQSRFILITTKTKKPDMNNPAMMELLKPLQDSITAVNDLRDANRGSPVFNHLSAVSESIGVLAWVTIDTKPHKHVEDMAGSAQYWGNRVLKEFKDK